MGNTCETSASVDLRGTPPVQSTHSSSNTTRTKDDNNAKVRDDGNNNSAVGDDSNNNAAAEEGNNNAKLEDDGNNNTKVEDAGTNSAKARDDGTNSAKVKDDSNNNADEDPKRCLEYVKKALDDQKVTTSAVIDYSDCLLEIPGEELLFDFDHIEIKDEDEVDDAVAPPAPLQSIEPGLIVPVNVADVGASVGGIDDDDDDDDELDVDTRTSTWQRKRTKEFDYILPGDKYSMATEAKFDVQMTKKRKIVALSDLHLGGSWSKGMDWKLEKYLEDIIEIANEEVLCLVLLGDIFEMWLEKFAEVPPSNEERVDTWKEAASVLIKATNKLTSECGVKVFYVRGNHDHEITEEDVAAVFGNDITFVPCTLILKLQTSSDTEHRVRLAHGHEWDVFNSYMLHSTKKLLPNRPIGYYIARAVATAGGEDSGSELEDLLIGLASGILSMIPSSLEDNLVDSLLDPDTHKKLLSRLFEGAFKVEDIDFLLHAKCRISQQQWIRLKTFLEYPLLKLCGSEVGKQDVFHMIKASTGDYKKFIKRSDEDVVVLAHTHRWDLKNYKNLKGNQVVYANTGCWTCNAEEFSTVIVSPPTERENGSVMIDYGKNEQSEN